MEKLHISFQAVTTPNLAALGVDDRTKIIKVMAMNKRITHFAFIGDSREMYVIEQFNDSKCTMYVDKELCVLLQPSGYAGSFLKKKSSVKKVFILSPLTTGVENDV